jgi:hypothetical protein
MPLTKLQTLPFKLRRYIAKDLHLSEDDTAIRYNNELADWLVTIGVPKHDFLFMGTVASSLGEWLRTGGDIITFDKEQSAKVSEAYKGKKVTKDDFANLLSLTSPRFIICHHGLSEGGKSVPIGLYVHRVVREGVDVYVMGIELPSEGIFGWFFTQVIPDADSPVGYIYRLIDGFVSGAFLAMDGSINEDMMRLFTGVLCSYLAPIQREVVEYHAPNKARRGRRAGIRARSYHRHHKVRRIDFESLTTQKRAAMPTGKPAEPSANVNPGSYNGPGYFVGEFQRRQWVREENARGERWLDIKEAKTGGFLVQVFRTCNTDGYHVGDYTTREERVRDVRELI